MYNSKQLVLAHFWLAFAAFVLALILGEWQMYVRSPLHPGLSNPELYYRSVTAHGTAMAYAFPTLIAMGFGYAIVELALKRPLAGLKWAWAAYILIVVGTIAAMVPVALGRASVLYTFYPPMIGNVFFYLGIVLVVVGSWIWVALMSINLHRWRKDNPGAPIPLAMFASVAGAYLWAWTSVGAALKILFQILPVALGFKSTIDAGLARLLFSWTLHAVVYFWLIPAYIAYYTLVPRAIGGRLYSDTMGRVGFVLFLVFSMPIGIHHVFQDPQVGEGFKFLHAVFTGLVSVPTLLTVFTITASVEIAGRLRGGRGMLGWLKTLPWKNPMMLAVAFSFIMLGFGGAGGMINMSYQLDFTVHNTQWITGHFHLIFGGAIVIMYFVIAYDLWPHLTGKALDSVGLMRLQLWLWFIGMIVVTFPWHYVGILSAPRRMAYFDYSDPAIAPQALHVTITFFGGLLLVVSALLFILPYAQGARTIAGLWDAICKAAAAPGGMAVSDMGSAKVISSDVIVIPQMISTDNISVGRGATLALRCTMCHGTCGMSEANTPNLAGQNAESTYKQLRDLQSGQRKSAIMRPHALNLSDQEMRDLAAYYAYLPRLRPPATLIEQLQAPRIVQIGSPMRNIAPCASCHGGSDLKSGTPYLDGEPETYLRAQLKAFADGSRHNDIHGQMRYIAREMTAEEIDLVAKYYSRR